VRICQHLTQPPSWRTTPSRLSATAYLPYSHYPPHWNLFFHLQPEDAPCHGDKDPLNTALRCLRLFYFSVPCPTPLCHISFCVCVCTLCVCVRAHVCILVKGTVCVGCSLKFRRLCCSHFICFSFDSSLLSCRN
jgi:hypothetical protein